MNRERMAAAVVLALFSVASLAVGLTTGEASRLPSSKAIVSKGATSASAVAATVGASMSVAAGESQTGCDAPVPEQGPRVPWPVVLTTECARFAVLRNGRVVGLGPPAHPRGQRVLGGGRAGFRSGHLVVTEGGRTVWRSARSMSTRYLDQVARGPQGVAFSLWVGGQEGLYIAAGGRAERKVARNEQPEGWLRSGYLLTSRYRKADQRSDLFIRTPDGRLAGSPGPPSSSFVVDAKDGTVLMVGEDGELLRSDGIATEVLADLRSLGFALGRRDFPAPALLPDGRIVVLAEARQVVLRPDGSVYGLASFARPKGTEMWIGWPPDGMVASPTTGVPAFIVTRFREGAGYAGWEGVYTMPEGSSRPVLQFGSRMRIAVCAHYSTLGWRGSWLLYSTDEGRVVAIDTAGRHPPVTLSGVAGRLPAPQDQDQASVPIEAAAWASFGTLPEPAAPTEIGVSRAV